MQLYNYEQNFGYLQQPGEFLIAMQSKYAQT